MRQTYHRSVSDKASGNKAEDHRHENPRQCYYRCGQSDGFYLLDVDVKSCVEHYKNNAYFRKKAEPRQRGASACEKILHRSRYIFDNAHEYTCGDKPYDLRDADADAYLAEYF